MNGSTRPDWASGGFSDAPLHEAAGSDAFMPLNVEPVSAPVPSSAAVGSSRKPAALGRATSSKKCILLAMCVTVGVALGVGLGLGLSGGDDSSGNSSSGTALALSAVVPPGCDELATGRFWEVLVAKQYNLTVQLAADMFNPAVPFTAFAASVGITFEVNQTSTSCVVLNARGITINSVSVAQQGGGGDGAVQVCGDGGTGGTAPGCAAQVAAFQRQSAATGSPLSTADTDLVAISLGGTELKAGSTVVVQLQYTATLGAWPSSEIGLYRSAPFVAQGGTTPEVLVVTQDAALGARLLLPCYDQPARKAVFQVTLQGVPEGMTALSNGAELPRESGSTTAVFQPTPVMSPLLLAIAVGSLKQYHAGAAGRRLQQADGTAGGTTTSPTLGFWTVPGLESQMELAAEIAPKALAFYTDYLKIDQPVTKFDFLAVPGKTGAMENWGLLMFDERRLLYNKDAEGAVGYLQAVNVICHEVAHQWFGNLATKVDWTMLSVDEGLATYMEYKCMEAVAPALANLGNVFFFRSSTPQLEPPGVHEAPAQLALVLASDPTQPAMVPPNDLTIGTGNYITYNKPAALMRTYELYLQESARVNVMPAILKRFVEKHSYGTWDWPDFMRATFEVLGEGATTPQAKAVLQLMEHRVSAMWAAQNHTDMLQIIDNGAVTMATWFYEPLYPIVALNQPNLINRTSYNETLFNIGATARPYCQYQISADQAAAVNAADEAEEFNRLCASPAGRRYFPLTLALDRLTDCSANEASGGWGTNVSALVDPQPPTWVDNIGGARLFRSVYSEEHFSSLLAVLGKMTTVCGSAAEVGGGVCCTRTSDLLEGGALLADAAELARSGHEMAVQVGLTPVRLLQAVEAAVLDAGDAQSGAWQYVIGAPAADALFQFKRATDYVQDSRCTLDYGAYIQRVLKRLSTAVSSDWGSTVPTDDILKQLAGPRLLWQVGLLDSPILVPEACTVLTGSNLWIRWVLPTADSEAEGGTGGVPLLPGGFDAGSGAATLSPDLVPALYMVGAAMPPSCMEVLKDEGGYNFSSTAQLAATMATALQNCALLEEDPTEAHRCLYALPAVALGSGDPEAIQTALNSTLTWLFSMGGQAPSGLDAVQSIRFSQRQVYLLSQLPFLLGNIARPNILLHQAVLSYLQGDWSSLLPPVVPATQAQQLLCGVMDALPPPSHPAAYEQVMALLKDARKAGQCPAALRIRVAGKAEQLQALGKEHAQKLCDFVAGRVAELAELDTPALLDAPPGTQP